MIVVAAVDGSETTEAVLKSAIEHAFRAGGEVQVVHVYSVPPAVFLAAGQATVDIDALAEADHSEVWDAVSRVMTDSPVPWHKVELAGPPAGAIVKHAVSVGADLIVTGTRGRGELASLILGSTSHTLIQEAPCEVLVVRSGELLEPRTD